MSNLFRRTGALYDSLYDRLDDVLFSVIMPDDVAKEKIRTDLLEIIKEDVTALVLNDPAARFKGDLVGAELIQEHDVDYVSEYKALQAVIDYRIAHCLQFYHRSIFAKDYSKESLHDLQLDLRKQARRISEESKVNTGIEIHPAAQIGRRFVIDHGFGTIIGETSDIGDDCYILQEVVLGATGVKGNASGRRHPKLGNHVEIAGGVRIYGSVTIGDNSIIYGNAIVTQDVPANSQVRVTNQIQITTPCETDMKIFGVLPEETGICIMGSDMNECSGITICDQQGVPIDNILCDFNVTDNYVKIGFKNLEELLKHDKIENASIRLNGRTNQMSIKNSIGWKDFIRNKKTE